VQNASRGPRLDEEDPPAGNAPNEYSELVPRAPLSDIRGEEVWLLMDCERSVLPPFPFALNPPPRPAHMIHSWSSSASLSYIQLRSSSRSTERGVVLWRGGKGEPRTTTRPLYIPSSWSFICLQILTPLATRKRWSCRSTQSARLTIMIFGQRICPTRFWARGSGTVVKRGVIRNGNSGRAPIRRRITSEL